MDFGKYKYEVKKKEQASRKKQHQVQVKEVRVRPRIGEHDLQVKVKQARGFLEEGNKVQLTCLFRGRELAHRDVGEKVVQHVLQLLQDVAKIERGAQMEGKRMVLLLTKK
jgi:translation initiation factor IF-3